MPCIATIYRTLIWTQPHRHFSLTTSTKKMEVLYQRAPGKAYIEPNIIINGQRLNAVEKFTYLGTTLSRNIVIDDEVNARLAKAGAAFERHPKSVWTRRGITIKTKIKVYKAAVLTTLLYGCETWTVYKRHAKLKHFHTTRNRWLDTQKLLGVDCSAKQDRSTLKSTHLHLHTPPNPTCNR